MTKLNYTNKLDGVRSILLFWYAGLPTGGSEVVLLTRGVHALSYSLPGHPHAVRHYVLLGH
jgi:hypothetical protein